MGFIPGLGKSLGEGNGNPLHYSCLGNLTEKSGRLQPPGLKSWTCTHCCVQFSWVAQSYPTLCDPIDCNTPSFPVYHQLPELAQTHVYQVSDAIQPPHPLSSPSSPALVSQFFISGGQSIGVSASASVLATNSQEWFPLGWTGLISLQSRGISRVFSTPQFKSISSSVLSFLCGPTLTSIHDYLKNHSFD